VKRKKMKNVNIRERETWNESERLGEKKKGERERKRHMMNIQMYEGNI
jgi:hypothetical protein